MKIKKELEALASKLEGSSSISEYEVDESQRNPDVDVNLANTTREKAKEISVELKSFIVFYNEYALPFELWEICLEMLYFAIYSGDADSRIVRETWARFIDQALSRGGIVEACCVLKRVGSQVYPGDGADIPLDTLCLQLEKAALGRSRLETNMWLGLC